MSPRDQAPGDGSPPRLSIAIVGGGVSGLGAAWLLSQRHDVTLYEKETRLGGHTNTVTVRSSGRSIAVDTGFIVYNEKNYPNLIGLFDRLGVATHVSDMSFSVSVDRGGFEYLGGEWSGLLAQPANLFKPGYWRMLIDVVRFFRQAQTLLGDGADDLSLGDWLARGGYSNPFIDDHLLPMAAAIWSVPVDVIRDFPARSFAHFFDSHGLLQLTRRPKWRTVSGGAAEYVKKIASALPGSIRAAAPVVSVRPDTDGAWVRDAAGTIKRFDQVVIATHADQALAMLEQPTMQEKRILGAFSYQPNLAVLHRDESLMPRRRRAWASWNYLSERERSGRRVASVTYWMNRLQGLDPDCPLFVSINPLRAPRDEMTEATFEYHHPVFNAGTNAAQAQLASIQGARNLWFCGSWCGYGFHEDALTSGLVVAEALGARRPWSVTMPVSSRWPAMRPIAGWQPALQSGSAD